MSAATTTPFLQPGRVFDFNEPQMRALQIDSFYSCLSGRGVSSLPEYKDYFFSWFTNADLFLTPAIFDANTSTWVKTGYVYYVVVVQKTFLPPIGQPTLMHGAEFYGLGIGLDGRSDRPDLQNYRFRFTCLGATSELAQIFYVIVTEVNNSSSIAN